MNFQSENLLQGLLKARGYYVNGQKVGLWSEPIQNEYSLNELFHVGEYYQDFRIGKWSVIYKDNKMDVGIYDKEGLKKGKWIELDEEFHSSKQITYKGEYNQKGMKVGRWDIIYTHFNKKEYKQIGGGFFDEDGGQKKIGKWIELFEGFKDYAQITYTGEYNRKGIKVGRWELWVNDKEYDQFIGQQIKKIISGGGSYDLDGTQKKVGKWIELDKGFMSFKQVTYNGQYNISGMKVGRWDIMFKEADLFQVKDPKGGGSYDKQGCQRKLGMWVELDEQFNSEKQVTIKGEYDTKGMKIGRWDIWVNYEKDDEWIKKQIGGGQYNQDGNDKKIGKWIEFNKKLLNHDIVTYNGEYDKLGMKIGLWVEMDIRRNKKLGEQKYDNVTYQKSI